MPCNCWLSTHNTGFGKDLLQFIAGNRFIIGTATLTLFLGVKAYRYYRMMKLREEWDDAGPNIVVVHTFKRGNTVPSITPFDIKLETFLRMAKIQYQIDTEVPMGPKGKAPWITINGEDYYDSELIIIKLQEMFNVYPDTGLTDEDCAVATAMRIMLEEHLYWGLVSWRYIEDNLTGLFNVQDVPFYYRMLLKFTCIKLKSILHGQGLGRHTISDLRMFMRKDFKALSTYIGTKQFMHGDKPRVVDCAIFGMLAEVFYGAPGSPYKLWMIEDFPELLAYMERMKAMFWPDWNNIVKKPSLQL